MKIVIAYIIILFIFFLIKRKQGSILRNSLYIIYLVSALAGFCLFFVKDPPDYVKYVPSYFPLLLLLFYVVLWSEPYSKISVYNNIVVKEKNVRLFNRMCNVIISIFIPCTVLLLYNSYNILSSVDLTMFRNEADYYQYFSGGVFFSLSVYLSILFFIPLLFYFISFRYGVSSYKQKALLFCSLSFTFMTLCFAGRDGITYWFMDAIVFYLFFKNDYNKSQKRTIRDTALLIVGISASVFLFITLFRFFGGTEIGDSDYVLLPLVNYLGQPIHIFPTTFSLSIDQIRALDSTNYLTYTFGTFVRTLIVRFGFVGSIIVSLVHLFLVRLYVSLFNRNRNLWDFLIVFVFFQIPFYGVFYYRQGLQSMEFVYLITFIAFYLFKKLKISIQI